jgi:intein-encoded DNA endonuclease-like protein
VYSKQLVCDLAKQGIETNKSLKDTIPLVDDSLFFDFLRGYIDGDGCYYVDNNHTYMHITCGNRVPLEYVQNKLEQFNIKTKIYTESDRKYRLMCTSFNEMNKLINCLYYKDDLFCLQRKYEKIKHFLGLTA